MIQDPSPIAIDEQTSPQSDIDVGVGIHVMKTEGLAINSSPMDALQETIEEEADVYNPQDVSVAYLVMQNYVIILQYHIIAT